MGPWFMALAGLGPVGLLLGAASPPFASPSYAGGNGTLPTHVNSCWSSDNGAPVLDSFTTSTSAVDVTDGPATVGITVRAHDVGGPGPAHPLRRVLHLQVYRDQIDPTPITVRKTAAGTWTGTFTVPHNAPGSPITFTYLKLKPGQGPSTSLSSGQLGPDATVQVTSQHPDTTPPMITTLQVSPPVVGVSHGRQRVSVTAGVTDDTAVDGVTVLAGGHDVFLTPEAHGFVGTFTVPRWQRLRTLPISITAYDDNRNVVSMSSADLAAAGLPFELSVRGTHPDDQGPSLTGLRLSSHRLRLRPDGWLRLRVHASDLGSGVRALSLRGLVWPSSGTVVLPGLPNHPLHLVSGTRRRGVWGARIHVACVPSSSLSRVRVIAHDVAGNRTATSRQRVRITGPDRTAPRGDDLDGGGVGHATVTFSEPVHGISTTGVDVSEHGSPPFYPGTWQCWTRSYAETSCRRGSVVVATFTATDPDAVIEHMDFAPDGDLDVLDRAGNPLLLESDAD